MLALHLESSLSKVEIQKGLGRVGFCFSLWCWSSFVGHLPWLLGGFRRGWPLSRSPRLLRSINVLVPGLHTCQNTRELANCVLTCWPELISVVSNSVRFLETKATLSTALYFSFFVLFILVCCLFFETRSHRVALAALNSVCTSLAQTEIFCLPPPPKCWG